MAREAASRRVENQWFRIPEQELTIGYEDLESDEGPDRYFAWDNEREPYDAKVADFEAQARPVSVGEYATFLVDTSKTDKIPAMWVRLDTSRGTETMDGYSDNTKSQIIGHAKDNTRDENGQPDDVAENHEAGDTEFQAFIAQHGIRTVWGPIPLSQAVDWPATASWNELTSYGEWRGGGVRLPTLHEVRSIHEYAARLKSQRPSTLNPIDSKNKETHTDPESIFVDLSGANVGLQNFHPVPVTHRGNRLCGLGDLGGAWEWTSTVFAPQPGFKPMHIYPGYSGRCTGPCSPYPSLDQGGVESRLH
ncbi:C-type lectin protein [Apiospora saccharicola]|uniref:C-type lectin protein n=1 Tax=Apiospora saccharicola TaxID=335842 RepID=A0ABR1TGU5_9PEZI